MTIKLGRKYPLLIILCAFLWNQQANVLSQKIAIENSYQQKVSSAVSRMLGQEKFLVIVGIEFSSIGGTLKKSATPQSGTGPSVGYIPGLPTLPSNQGSELYPWKQDQALRGRCSFQWLQYKVGRNWNQE